MTTLGQGRGALGGCWGGGQERLGLFRAAQPRNEPVYGNEDGDHGAHRQDEMESGAYHPSL
jgi:hypothetical protein